MKKANLDLTQSLKREYFTKAELNSYIDDEIKKLKNINPMLENATLVKISSQSNSMVEYFMCRENFINDSKELLNNPYFCIWPKFQDNGNLTTYLLITTGTKKQGYHFMQDFAIKYLWPISCEFIAKPIYNVSELINFLLQFKNQINKTEQEMTRYKKDDNQK